MSPKKKNQAPQAQQLIDSLLDEKTPAPNAETKGSVLRMDETRMKSKGPGTTSAPIVVEYNEDEASAGLRLEESLKGKLDPVAKADREAREAKKAAEARAKKALPVVDNNDVTRTLSVAQVAEANPTSSKQAGGGLQDVTVTGAGGLNSVTPQEGDGTVRLDLPPAELSEPDISMPKKRPEVQAKSKPAAADVSEINRMDTTEIKTVLKMKDRNERQEPPPRQMNQNIAAGGFSSAEAQLKQSENLRIAQMRITELEQELERLRRENEKLATAGETLRRRTDDLISKAENLEISSKEQQRIFEEEKKVYRGQLQQKDREAMELRGRLEEMESRLESNFKKIRVRERELEHRLEIVKMESATLVSTKDKMILELKRQIDQLTHENDYGKQKAQELFNQYKDKQETARRVVRALRIALTILEGDEDSGNKKSE
jgi:tellurite resistance protein